jgi:hypothetical protein
MASMGARIPSSDSDVLDTMQNLQLTNRGYKTIADDPLTTGPHHRRASCRASLRNIGLVAL